MKTQQQIQEYIDKLEEINNEPYLIGLSELGEGKLEALRWVLDKEQLTTK